MPSTKMSLGNLATWLSKTNFLRFAYSALEEK